MNLLAVSVGNTRTRAGLFQGREIERSTVEANSDATGMARAIAELARGHAGAPAIVASVNNDLADGLAGALAGLVPGGVYRIGRDLPVPIRHALTDASTVGQDRLLNALAIFERSREAAVIVDAGTAITVDFVDGAGVFRGGAIAPGPTMMLRALHEHTAALPRLAFEPVGEEVPFGRSTREAMLIGVRSAAVGLVRLLLDRYAEAYGAYPRVVATGGDAPALFEGDPLIDRIVPDLTLIGIQVACEKVLGEQDEEPEANAPAGEGPDGEA